MKVVGTGAPRMLTIRFEPCEVDGLRNELEERRTEVVEAVAEAQHHAKVGSPSLSGERARCGLEDRHDELLLISQLLDDLRRPAPSDRQRQVVGPTWLLGDVIRHAAGEAVDRLVRAVEEFRQDRGRPDPDALRTVLWTAVAWVETLIGLDYTDNHAVDY